jgi:hypothetical protein
VIATGYLKHTPGIGKRSLLHILYPGAVHSKWNTVFSFAGDGAGMAANALAIVDDEPVSHRKFCRPEAKSRAAWVL